MPDETSVNQAMDAAQKQAEQQATSPTPQPAAPSTPRFDFSSISDELDGLAISGHREALNDLRGYISTGCCTLDAEIGQGIVLGGYPIGRFTEIFGIEGSSKTTLATHALISAQQGRGTLLTWEPDASGAIMPVKAATQMQPGLGILIDSEFKWPLDRAQRMGLKTEQLVRVLPKKDKGETDADARLSLEECLESLEKTLNKVKANSYFQRPDVPVLVVWDSLAASPTEAELEGDGLQDGIAGKARKVRAAMRRFTGMLAALNVTVLIINQVYDRIGTPGVEASGGRGLKFHSSHRIQLKKQFPSKLMVSSEEVGILVDAQCVKSSICPPTHNVSIPVRFLTGIDDDLALLEFFNTKKKLPGNPITQSGAWMKCAVPGKDAPVSFQYGSWSKILRENEGLRDHLLSEMLRILRSS